MQNKSTKVEFGALQSESTNQSNPRFSHSNTEEVTAKACGKVFIVNTITPEMIARAMEMNPNERFMTICPGLNKPNIDQS